MEQNNFLNKQNNMMNMNNNNMMNMNNMDNMNNMNNMNIMNNNMMMMNNMINMNQTSIGQNMKNEIIIKLLNQNNKLSNQIEKNNNTIKNIINNQNLDPDNSYEDILDHKQYVYNLINEIDFFLGYKQEKINIIFNTNFDFGIPMNVPKDVPIKEMLKAFYIKLQIFCKMNSKLIYEFKQYYFLFNGMKLRFDENRTLLDLGFINGSKIIFDDYQNIIGGRRKIK